MHLRDETKARQTTCDPPETLDFHLLTFDVDEELLFDDEYDVPGSMPSWSINELGVPRPESEKA